MLSRLRNFLLISGLFALTGCYQIHSDDADLRTIPVTNNPTIVPQTAGMNMMPAQPRR